MLNNCCQRNSKTAFTGLGAFERGFGEMSSNVRIARDLLAGASKKAAPQALADLQKAEDAIEMEMGGTAQHGPLFLLWGHIYVYD